MVLNIEKLASMVRSKRGNLGLRTVAKEIGDVSASTLSRVEQGYLPDIQTFFKLCAWLEVSTDYFKTPFNNTESNERDIVAHLRADRNLDSSTSESLIKMITLAYEQKKRNS